MPSNLPSSVERVRELTLRAVRENQKLIARALRAIEKTRALCASSRRLIEQNGTIRQQHSQIAPPAAPPADDHDTLS